MLKLHDMIFILAITKIFDNVYACNSVCRLKSPFPYLFCQKSHVSAIFYPKPIFAYYKLFLCIIMDFPEILRAH